MYKECKVVMLPTNEKAPIWKDNLIEKLYTFQCNSSKTNSYQNLYIISNDKIKDDNYFMSFFYSHLLQNTKKWRIIQESIIKDSSDCSDLKFHKVIATTNIKFSIKGEFNHRLNEIQNILPQPSQTFIEKYVEEYNKGNIITDVLVEYDEVLGKYSKDILDTYFVPKVNPKDNTITIENKPKADDYEIEDDDEYNRNWLDEKINF